MDQQKTDVSLFHFKMCSGHDAIHLANFVNDVKDTDCQTQNGSIHGHFRD